MGESAVNDVADYFSTTDHIPATKGCSSSTVLAGEVNRCVKKTVPEVLTSTETVFTPVEPSEDGDDELAAMQQKLKELERQIREKAERRRSSASGSGTAERTSSSVSEE